MKMDTRRACKLKVFSTELGSFLDSSTGVVEEKQKSAITKGEFAF
jgi:hypothetical protein